MAEEENNSEEEVAKETTLQDMVEQLSESNILQKSLQESSMETTKVLTSIAKILQAQLDLSEQQKLDEGREFGKPSGDDKPSKSPFEKLEMPTSVAEGFGMGGAFLVGSIKGFLQEVRGWFTKRTKEVKGFTSKTMRTLSNTWKFMKQDFSRMISAIGNLVTKAFKFIAQPLYDLRATFSAGGKIDKMLKGFVQFFKLWQGFFVALTRVATRIIAFIVAPIIGVMHAIEEFNSQESLMAGLVAGALGFITGVIKFMIVELADLVKSVLSWIVEKIFGDGNPFSKFLDSFSFSELFVEGMHLIRDWILSIPEYFMDALKRGRESGLGMAGLTSVLLSDLGGFVANLFGFLSEMFYQGLMKIPGMLATVQFAEDFGKAVVESLKDAWKALKGYFNKAVDWVVGLLDKVSFDFDSNDMVKVFTDFYDDMIKGFSKFFGRAWDSIKKIFGIEDTAAIPMSSQGGTPQGAAQGGSTWYNPSTWSGGDDKEDAAPPPVETPEAQYYTPAELKDMDMTDLEMASLSADPTNAALAKEEMNVRLGQAGAHKVATTPDKPDTSHLRFNAVTGETIDTSKSYAASMGQDLGGSSMGTGGYANPEDAAEGQAVKDAANAEHKLAYDRRQAEKKLLKIPETIRRAKPEPVSIPDFRLRERDRARAAGRYVSSVYKSEVSPLIEAPTGGSAVSQGQALQSGTSNMKDAKSKQQQGGSPIIVSSPNNSQTSNSKVSNNYTSSNVAAHDVYDPMTRYQPGTANW